MTKRKPNSGILSAATPGRKDFRSLPGGVKLTPKNIGQVEFDCLFAISNGHGRFTLPDPHSKRQRTGIPWPPASIRTFTSESAA